MGDFDDGMEMGLWGSDGIPDWDDEYEREEVFDDREHIIIQLTPSKFLKEHQKNKRDELFRNYDKFDYGALVIVHNRYNKDDKFALEVYYQRVFIGHVRGKFNDNNNTDQINDFCFIKDFFCDTGISYKNRSLFLYHSGSHSKDGICDNTYKSKIEIQKTYRVQVDNILYKFNNVPQQNSEALTIKYALRHRDSYSFNDDMIAAMKMRLPAIASEVAESTGREIGLAIIEVTSKVLEETFSVVGKIFNFIKK